MASRIATSCVLATLLGAGLAALAPVAAANPACGYAIIEEDCSVYCYDPEKGWGYHCVCDLAVLGTCIYDKVGAFRTTLLDDVAVIDAVRLPGDAYDRAPGDHRIINIGALDGSSPGTDRLSLLEVLANHAPVAWGQPTPRLLA